ncbi:unnamed protein product [Urochloa humidicola]
MDVTRPALHFDDRIYADAGVGSVMVAFGFCCVPIDLDGITLVIPDDLSSYPDKITSKYHTLIRMTWSPRWSLKDDITSMRISARAVMTVFRQWLSLDYDDTRAPRLYVQPAPGRRLISTCSVDIKLDMPVAFN